MTASLKASRPFERAGTIAQLARPHVAPDGGLIGRWVRRRVVSVLDTYVRDGDLSVVFADGEVRQFGAAGHARAATIHIHTDRFFARLARSGRMALGDGFVAGEWSADDPAIALEILARSLEHARGTGVVGALTRLAHMRPRRAWRSTRRTAPRHVRAHYDLGNDLFELVLDPTMAYSCGYFESPGVTLQQAQIAKFDRMCRKLQLQPGDRLLDIGCGWGGFACYAARTYGAHVVGVTLSRQQHAAAVDRARREGVSDLVDIQLIDYRDVVGQFDKIASTEMFEAIGVGEFRRYFAVVERLLAPQGIVCMQTIALPDQHFDGYLRNEDWTQRNIFPGGQLPSLEAIQESLRSSSTLMVHDVEEIGIHYARTLREWRSNFLGNLDRVRELGYPERFERVFAYYLYFCEAGFRARILRDMQIVLTRTMNDTLVPVRH